MFFSIVVSLLILHRASADVVGLLSSTSCQGYGFAIQFNTSSTFAKQTFANASFQGIVVVQKQGDANYLTDKCGGDITAQGTVSNPFNYSSSVCNAEIVTILLPDDKSVQTVTLDLQAHTLSPPSPPDSVEFTVTCTYLHSVNTSGNATINTHNHTNPGNNTGNVNGTDIDAITNLRSTFTTLPWSPNTEVVSVDVGAAMGFGLQFNDSKTSDYKQMNPYYCFFSPSDNASAEAGYDLPFISYNCPDSSINSMGLDLVSNWTDYGSSTRFLIDFLAFQFEGHDMLYIHCVVNLCINDECENATNACTTKDKWTANSTTSFYSRDFQSSDRLEIVEYAKANQNTHVIKSVHVHVKSPESGTTIWYIVVGVIAGLFVVSIVVLGILMARRRKAVYVEKRVAGDTRYIVPFQIPRAQLDPASLPTSSRGSVATVSDHGSSARSTTPLTTF